MNLKPEERELIYRNLLNGVSAAQVATAFHITESEVMTVFKDASLRVANHLITEAIPWFPCQTLKDARARRMQIFQLLPRVSFAGPVGITCVRTADAARMAL